MTADFHPDAEAELESAAHWYEDCSDGLGVRFASAVRAAVVTIQKDPDSYQPVDERIRVFRLKRFPYRIYFSHDVALQHVRIYAVMHEKRETGYWKKRLTED